MNRRGFMQTLFGGAVAALLPRTTKAKDVEGGRLLPQTVQDKLVSAMPPDVPTLAALPQAERDRVLGLPKDVAGIEQQFTVCNTTVDGGKWDCEYFEIKLISNGEPLTCDITTTHGGKGICYTVYN